MCEVQDEESVGPAPKSYETNAQTTEVCRRVQNLSGVHSPRHRGVGDINHAKLLSEWLIDIVDIAERWIPTCVEELCQLSAWVSAARVDAAYEVVEECQAREVALKFILGIDDCDEQPRKSEELHFVRKERMTRARKTSVGHDSWKDEAKAKNL
jgi:hypothetical protein